MRQLPSPLPLPLSWRLHAHWALPAHWLLLLQTMKGTRQRSVAQCPLHRLPPPPLPPLPPLACSSAALRATA